jgi:pseudouridine-5'-phosphate glycosidase
LGYQTKRFPGFYLTDSGYVIEHEVNSPTDIATIWRNRSELRTDNTAIVIANPVKREMERALHDQILETGLQAAIDENIVGKAVTPFLLEYFHTHSEGESLRVNIDIIKSNALLAAHIAIAMAETA